MEDDKEAAKWTVLRRDWQQEREQKAEASKVALKKLLSQHEGIWKIEAEYDGSSDEGQIDELVFLGQTNEPIDPIDDVLRLATEECIYDVIDVHADGWEINEGGYGRVVIDAKTLSGSVEHSFRIETIEHCEFEF